MYAKIQITGNIEVVTGMHIGGNVAFAAIGAVDSPVIKDALTGNPLIPGSSLKGKMRTLLAKQYNEKIAESPDEDDEKILRLFGSAKKEKFKLGKLLFSDMALDNPEELRRVTDSLTETKFENTINRITAEANPRQIERVIRGSQFKLDIIYEISRDADTALIIQDFEIISEGLKLLQYDYIGGSGTRGYGKIKISDLNAACVVGEVDGNLLEKINLALQNNPPA
jgi:CRISPR-associated protein Csm3